MPTDYGARNVRPLPHRTLQGEELPVARLLLEL
jgi:hypothetical protein